MIKRICAPFIIGTLMATACTTGTTDAWTDSMKAKIIAEANMPTDSSFTTVSPVGFEKVKFFSNGTLTREKWYHDNNYQSVEVQYSTDGRFTLRRELCRDGRISFEGIFVDGQACGLSTWWNCETNSITEQGVRYKGKYVGFWTTQENGKSTQVNHGKFNLIDSLSTIR